MCECACVCILKKGDRGLTPDHHHPPYKRFFSRDRRLSVLTTAFPAPDNEELCSSNQVDGQRRACTRTTTRIHLLLFNNNSSAPCLRAQLQGKSGLKRTGLQERGTPLRVHAPYRHARGRRRPQTHSPTDIIDPAVTTTRH